MINGVNTIIPAGHILIFPPHVAQIYTYYANDNPEIFWIHFTGTDCYHLIDSSQIKQVYIGENLQIKTLFQEIIQELQLKKILFENIIIHDLYKLLTLIERSKSFQHNFSEDRSSLDRLIIQLNHHYMDAWTISSMASYCNLSKDYFAHYFKKTLGLAPMHFLTRLRIEKAVELLQDEDLSVSYIASLVGYEDALYFSRVFKKATGFSPKTYHKMITSNARH